MHELVYVLTVEAAVFGSLGVLLAAQRWNVLQWSDTESLPVFSSSLVLMFAYAQVLLLLGCAIAVGKFGELTFGVMDACARSAGRLATAAVLSACYVAALLVMTDASEPHLVPCFLAHLFGSSCTAAKPVLWSYSIYFSVLLPVWALVAGLQVTAAGMCKNPKQVSRARLLTANSAFLLTFMVNTSLRDNVGCRHACGEVLLPENQNTEVDRNLLFLIGSLCLSDVLAECLLHFYRVHPLALLSPSNAYAVRGTTAFYVLHAGQVLGVFFYHRVAVRTELQLPSVLMYVHTGIAGVLCVLDIVQVLVHHPVAKQQTQQPASEPQRETLLDRLQTQQTQLVQEPLSNKPFEVDHRSRRKFMMTFNGRSRWPAVLDVPNQKKST